MDNQIPSRDAGSPITVRSPAAIEGGAVVGDVVRISHLEAPIAARTVYTVASGQHLDLFTVIG
jgi:hypothetical protein